MLRLFDVFIVLLLRVHKLTSGLILTKVVSILTITCCHDTQRLLKDENRRRRKKREEFQIKHSTGYSGRIIPWNSFCEQWQYTNTTMTQCGPPQYAGDNTQTQQWHNMVHHSTQVTVHKHNNDTIIMVLHSTHAQDTTTTKTWSFTGYNHNKNMVLYRIQPRQKHGLLQDTATKNMVLYRLQSQQKHGPLQDTATKRNKWSFTWYNHSKNTVLYRIQPRQKHGPLPDTTTTKTRSIYEYNHNKNMVLYRIQTQQKQGPLQDTTTTKT